MMIIKNRIKTILTLTIMVMAMLTVSSYASVGELGILDLTANGSINPNTGVAWQIGDQYRLAFHTLGKHNATSNDPAVYNDFVTAEAQLNPALVGSTWFALVTVNLDNTTTQALSPKIDAKTNSGTDDLTGGAVIGGAGVPVYTMDGTTCIARNNADIWNGWSNPFDGDTTVRIASVPVHYSPFLDQYGNQTEDPDINHGMDCITGSVSTGTARTPLGNTTDSTQANWGSSNANNPGRVWLRWDSGSLTGNWSFYAISEPLTFGADPNAPTVVAGDDKVTWSGELVQLAPDVTNNDTEVPPRDLTYHWSADPNTGVGFSDPDVEAPTVTITKAGGDPVTVTLTLTVTLVDSTSDPVEDTMTIDAYDDPCLAAVGVGLAVIELGDFDEDCDTDFEDYALLAEKWLVNYELSAPVPKP